MVAIGESVDAGGIGLNLLFTLMEKKTTTFARNPQQLARAILIDARKGTKEEGKVPKARAINKLVPEILKWIAMPGFPKKTPKGYVIAQVRTWVEGRKSRVEGGTPNLTQADKPAEGDDLFESDSAGWERTLDLWQDKLNHPEKWLALPLQNWQLKKLERYRPQLFGNSPVVAQEPANKSPTGAGTPNLEAGGVMIENDLCDNFQDIANRMDQYYRNADGSSLLQHEISGKTISDWKNKRRLNNKPGPPGKVNSRQWSAGQWISWFHKHFWLEWKLPETGTGQMEAFGEADLRKMQLAEDFKKLEDAQRERDIRDGRYKSVELVNRSVIVLGATLNRHLSEHAEKGLTSAILPKLKQMMEDGGLKMADGSSDLSAIYNSLSATVLEEVRRAVDALRDGLAQTLREIKLSEEPEGVTSDK